MNRHARDPKKVFPEEVLWLHEVGVPLPTWFSGPLRTSTITNAQVVEAVYRARSEPPPEGESE